MFYTVTVTGKTNIFLKEEIKMKDFEQLNDNAMENVVGGISQDEALAVALKHAGIEKDQLDFVKNKLDFEHGRRVYDIEFYVNGFEYEYDIDAVTGKILKFDKDRDD